MTQILKRLKKFVTSYLPENQTQFLRQLRPENLRLRTKGRLLREDFREIETYCMFLGYQRSGHSLVGQLLNAHEHTVIAHEAHALSYLQRGFSVAQIYARLLEADRDFERGGRLWTGDYDYNVPGLEQGNYTDLKVIGDKKGEGTTIALSDHQELFGKLHLFGVPIRVIHHVRNPYDNIGSICRRYGYDVNEAIDIYFERMKSVRRHLCTMAGIEQIHVIETHHEELIQDTSATLSKLLDFLGLEASPDYLKACSSVVFDSPVKSREKFLGLALRSNEWRKDRSRSRSCAITVSTTEFIYSA